MAAKAPGNKNDSKGGLPTSHKTPKIDKDGGPPLKSPGLDGVFRGENEILLDGICHDLRKGLSHGLVNLRKNHMQGKIDVNQCDEFGCYLLMAAAQSGMLDAVQDLLARGARINQKDDYGNTALHMSVLMDRPSVSAFLLEQGADPEQRNHLGFRPGELLKELFYGAAFKAVKKGEVDAVMNLFGRDFIPKDITEEQCDTSHIDFIPRVFHERIKGGVFLYELVEETQETANAEQLEFLSRHPSLKNFSIDLDTELAAGQQAPEEAVGPDEASTEEVSAMSIDDGPEEVKVDKVLPNLTGRTLLMYAAEGGYLKLIKELVRCRANILMQDSRGDTAISLAKAHKYFDVARFLNERIPESEQTEIMTEETVELNELRKDFDTFCMLGSADIGAAKKGGRASTMDFIEFLKYLTAKGLAGPGNPCSKDTAFAIFNWQMEVSTASGELGWLNFKQCLHRLARQLDMDEIQGVPTEDLLDHSPLLDNQTDILKMPLTKVSRKCLQRELETMQRSLDLIGDRCKQITSCGYAAYGNGVTTGRHKLRNETFDVYRKLLRAPEIRMKMPKFTKDKELMKKEMLAKKFFNLIDKDRSGTLTRYELQWALEDFGFSKEEQAEVFQAVDGDNSGTVTLSEFLAGMGEGTVSFAGRESKSGKKQTYLDIGLKISKAVTQKEQPQQVLSVSPGLFSMIYKIFCDHAMKNRIYKFEEYSCLFAAPKTSALIPEKKVVKKKVLGVNTRFAVSNPFDPRVLANSGPVKSFADVLTLDDSPRDSLVSTPKSKSARSKKESPRSTNESKSPKNGKPNEVDTSSKSESKKTGPLERDEEIRTPARTPSNSFSENRKLKHPYPIKTFEEHGDLKYEHSFETEHSASIISTDSFRLGTPSQAGSRRAASAFGMIPSLTKRRQLLSQEPQLTESPDGSLLSEHTRVTLIPHRLTVTFSGQVLVGGSETTDPEADTSISASAVKKHRITLAGLSILKRLVFHSMSFGAGHCAALTDTGLIYTWGQGRYGQLGHGDEQDRIVPQPVLGIKCKVKALSASFYHNLAITVNGSLFSWGDGKDGKLGHNDNAGRLIPTIVSYFIDRGLNVTAAQAGGSHSVALTSYNQLYTFGFGCNGRLGHGTDQDMWLPTMVSALELYSVVSLAAGYAHTIALTDDGQIFTWGSGKLGRLGHGSDSDEVLRSDGSMVTVGRVTHGRFAEGVCVGEYIKLMRQGLAMQDSNDWHHFPS